MSNVYIKDLRNTQTFDPLTFDDLKIPDGNNELLCIPEAKPQNVELLNLEDNSSEYISNFTVDDSKKVNDRTFTLTPVPVFDKTYEIDQYTMDRVNYNVFLGTTSIDGLDHIKELP